MDEAVQRDDAGGKKIFFLNPHNTIRDEVIDILVRAGFEAYVCHDAARVERLLTRFPGSVVFINIDGVWGESEWERYIQGLLGNSRTKGSKVGVISYSQNDDLKRRFLENTALSCGFIQLKLGLQAGIKNILETLTENNARGRRRYLRTSCENDPNAVMNYKSHDGFFQGNILDISSAGMAARIPNFIEHPIDFVFNNVQLKLHGLLVMTDAVFRGKRRNDDDVYVMLFELEKMSSEHKQALHQYIKRCLQKYIDELAL